MKRFWRVFKVLMFSLFLIGIYAFTIWLAIRFQGDYRLLVILMTIGMIAVTPKLIEKIKTHPDAEKKKPVKSADTGFICWPILLSHQHCAAYYTSGQESQTPEILSGLSPGLWPDSSCWTFSLSILPVNSMWMTRLRILVY